MTLQDLVDTFLEQYDGVPSSKDRLDQYLRKATSRFGDEPIGALDAPAIAQWRASLPGTMRHGAHGALRHVLGAAVRWCGIEHDAASNVRNPTHSHTEFVPFADWAEVEDVATELGPFGPLVISASVPGCARRRSSVPSGVTSTLAPAWSPGRRPVR